VATPKLQGLAVYAETHASAYRRIESVAEAMGKLRVLDLTNEVVRQAIASAKDAASLFCGTLAREY
jgi:type III restriction enzyme